MHEGGIRMTAENRQLNLTMYVRQYLREDQYNDKDDDKDKDTDKYFTNTIFS